MIISMIVGSQQVRFVDLAIVGGCETDAVGSGQLSAVDGKKDGKKDGGKKAWGYLRLTYPIDRLDGGRIRWDLVGGVAIHCRGR